MHNGKIIVPAHTAWERSTSISQNKFRSLPMFAWYNELSALAVRDSYQLPKEATLLTTEGT